MFCSQIANVPFLVCVALAIPIYGLNDSVAAEESDPPMITVSGSAVIQVVPDHAVLRFSIDSRALEVAAAVNDNDEKVNAVVAFLTESKVQPNLVRTELLRIQPIFDTRSKQTYQQQISNDSRPSVSELTAEQKIKPIGYSARRQISVTINDLASFESIYRGLIERGVNEVDSLQFHSSELRKHRDEARLQAVRAARQKAEAMASELGCSLAAVQSINEAVQPGWRGSNFQYNQISVAAGDASGSVASGMINISATINVVFVLGDVTLND